MESLIDGRFRDKKRMLDFLVHAPNATIELTLVESERIVRAKLDAVDAKQTRLHLRSLPTPLGTYPHATLRTSDVLCATLRSAWQLSQPLPRRNLGEALGVLTSLLQNPLAACHIEGASRSDSAAAAGS